MVTGGNRSYIWDFDNRLSSVTTGGVSSFMSYDYTGIRVKKDGSRGITTYPFSGYEIDPNGVITKYIRSGIENLAAKKSTGDTLFYHNDHLGGVNIVTSSLGIMAQIIEYDPWGKVSREEGIGDSVRRFTGKQLDPESGLYYYGGRYYDADLGRFISPDPFVGQPDDPQNLNRYSYVGNNPVNYIDPSGFKKKKKKGFFSFFKKIIGFIVGAIVTVVTGNPVLGGAVGGAVNAAVNDQNVLVGAVTGGVTAGITAGILGGLSPPGSDFGSLTPALIGTNVGVAASDPASRAARGSSSGSSLSPGSEASSPVSGPPLHSGFGQPGDDFPETPPPIILAGGAIFLGRVPPVLRAPGHRAPAQRHIPREAQRLGSEKGPPEPTPANRPPPRLHPEFPDEGPHPFEPSPPCLNIGGCIGGPGGGIVPPIPRSGGETRFPIPELVPDPRL